MRQKQALSFTAHIPLVCFGIAFPVMMLLMEWWGQRTGDPLCHLVTGFVMAGVYATARLRGRWTRYERAAIVLPLMFTALAAPVQFLVGDWAARTISRDEPTKLAAIEGLAKRPGAPRCTSSACTSTGGSGAACGHGPDAFHLLAA